MEHIVSTPREERFSPTADDLKNPVFLGIFDVIKKWDVNIDDTGLHHGTGTDAVEILRAITPHLSTGISKQEIESAVAGALFDFCGRLTTVTPPITLGSSYSASIALDLLTRWANDRGLSLNNANVLKWSETLKR